MKPGYKQTEVGVIPEDWEVATLKQLVSLVVDNRGKTPPLASHGHPLIEVNAIYGAARTPDFTQVTKFIDQRTYESWFRRGHPKSDDLLIATVGTAGASAIVGEYVGCIAQNIVGLRVAKNYNAGFLFQFTRTERFLAQVRAVLMGAVQPSLKVPHLLGFSVPLPTTEAEQRAIAEALSDVDGLLGGLARLIAKKRDLKQAAMQQLLTGQTRLPGFHGEWEVKTLFDLAGRKKELFDDGDWIESEHIKTEGIRLIQTGNIGVGSFIEKGDKKYINEASFSSLRCKQLMRGDLLVCRLAEPAGRCCVLPDIGEERVVTSVDVTIFRPPQELADRHFLCQVFSTPDWFKAVSDRSGGTTHKRISRGALGRLSINLPRVPEQTAIAQILSDMDAELTALEQRREKTLALKQAMMQELLTGRTRLV